MIKVTFELDTTADLACLTDIMEALLQRSPQRSPTPGTTPDTWPFPNDEVEVKAPEPAPTATVEDVRKVLAAMTKDAALELLAKFNAKKVGDLNKEDYAALVAASKES